MTNLINEINAARLELLEGATHSEGALVELADLVAVWARAKGRYHTQIAAADLMNAIGLKGVYPEGYGS